MPDASRFLPSCAAKKHTEGTYVVSAVRCGKVIVNAGFEIIFPTFVNIK